MSTSGLLLCSSTMIHSAQTARPAASRPRVRALVQPQTEVCAMAISTQHMPMLISAAATQLTRPGARAPGGGMNKRAPTADTSITGSGIQNSQCQFRCSSMRPPTTRPKPPPIPRMADISPMLPGTRSRGNSSRMTENDSGKMPPATPWMTRATIRTPSELAAPPRAVPAASTSSVPTSSGRLPCMSPSLPMIAVPTEADSRNPVSSHVTPVSLAPRLRWNTGSAGMTAELSTA